MIEVRSGDVLLPYYMFCAIIGAKFLWEAYMAFLVRLLVLMALSVSVWFVPISLLVCSGKLSWLIPISQGVPKLSVLLMILLLPPLLFLLLVWVALGKPIFS